MRTVARKSSGIEIPMLTAAAASQVHGPAGSASLTSSGKPHTKAAPMATQSRKRPPARKGKNSLGWHGWHLAELPPVPREDGLEDMGEVEGDQAWTKEETGHRAKGKPVEDEAEARGPGRATVTEDQDEDQDYEAQVNARQGRASGREAVLAVAEPATNPTHSPVSERESDAAAQ